MSILALLLAGVAAISLGGLFGGDDESGSDNDQEDFDFIEDEDETPLFVDDPDGTHVPYDSGENEAQFMSAEQLLALFQNSTGSIDVADDPYDPDYVNVIIPEDSGTETSGETVLSGTTQGTDTVTGDAQNDILSGLNDTIDLINDEPETLQDLVDSTINNQLDSLRLGLFGY